MSAAGSAHQSKVYPPASASRRRGRKWTALVACLAGLCASLLPAAPAFADGSVDFNLGGDSTRRKGLMGWSTTNAPYRHSYSVLRVYARAGETIQMGSSAMGLGGSSNTLVYAPGTDFASASDPTVRAPYPSDPVFATDVRDCNADAPGTGRISSRAQELAGPAPNPGGYTPCEFVAPATGIYSVLMLPFALNNTVPFTNSVGTPVVTTGQQAQISIWDVTVRDTAGNAQPGRVFANRLGVGEAVAGVGSDVRGFVYTPTGHVYRVQIFANNGVAWDLAANGVGVIDAGTQQPIFASFQWGFNDAGYPATPAPTHAEAVAPQMSGPDLARDGRYPIFVREPDPAVISGPGGLAETRGFASAPIPPMGGISGLSFVGSGGEQGATVPGGGGTVNIVAPASLEGMGYTVAIDLDKDGTFGNGNDVQGTGSLSSTGSTFAWDGRDAAGATSACGTYAYNVRATSPTFPALHLVQSDTENSGGTQIERLTLPADPALADPFAASYNDVDPYKATAITNAAPSAVTAGASDPGFHAWSANTGHTDFIDTWVPGVHVTGSNSLRVLCPGEVSVDKRASDGRLVVGDTVTYRLVARNDSSGEADGVVVEDRVPSKLDVRSASTTQGDCTVSGNRVRCEIGALAPGAEATVTVRAVAVEAGQTTNVAISEAERCPQAQCDSDPAKVTIVKPKLRVAKTAGKRRVRAGNVVTYAIRVTNPSKAAVRNVRTCDNLPAGLVALKASPKVKVSKGRYCWTAKRLGAGKSKRYELTVRTLPGAAGRTVNTATASSGGVRGTARAARAVQVLPRQAAGGGVTG